MIYSTCKVGSSQLNVTAVTYLMGSSECGCCYNETVVPTWFDVTLFLELLNAAIHIFYAIYFFASFYSDIEILFKWIRERNLSDNSIATTHRFWWTVLKQCKLFKEIMKVVLGNICKQNYHR